MEETTDEVGFPLYGEWWRWTVTQCANGFVTPGTQPFIWRQDPEPIVRRWFRDRIRAGELELVREG